MSLASMLCQELQERLVKCPRILEGQRVCGIGNRHQVAAGQTPHDDLLDQGKVARRLCPTHNERGDFHTAQGGA